MIRPKAALSPLGRRPPVIDDLSRQKRSDGRCRHGRRVVDKAAAILAALRRCSIEAAMEELITAGERYRMPVSTIASALVTLAGGQASPQRPGTAAQLAAELEWGENYWPPPGTAGISG
jgi:hypothetical protein